jgi:tetratricopeptide (TPR) repeat protein
LIEVTLKYYLPIGMNKDKKEAGIKKELIPLVTYPYSDPSPIPEFGRLYPYNRFDGYTSTAHEQEWEMIVMENDYIKLWINPAVGGKIWGAIEKATNKEFIYFNHVAKFRDVAMRGPWTSGGMENNMGIVGHTPSCSSPVDHLMRKNDDGSVSCFIGATDWPSRTSWTVEVCLPANTAYFITRCSWYNNSGLEQSYYQWNNTGVKAAGNLEYINPAYQRLGHDGKHFSWPVDENGRDISYYEKNDHGEYKSYHLFGSYADFWGCYWHNDNFGFGHSASYDDKPGKKIWIWGLSRYGLIWEDLLTDNDGQYTEVQSGKAFNQSISASSKTPFKHNSFLPYAADNWDEYWFPVKNIGGLTYGNALLSFYLSVTNGTTQLNICANQDLNHTLKIECGDKIVLVKDLVLNTMQTTVVNLHENVILKRLKVWLNDELIYNAPELNQHLSRPAAIPQAYNFDSVEAIYIQAKEWERQRFFERAVDGYRACLKKDPYFIEALSGLAGLLIRQKRYHEALILLLTALSINTYHAETNYLYGIVNTRVDYLPDAKDGFSIASQSITYRSAAYLELAKIFFKENQLNKSLSYLKKALQYNTNNRQALILEMIINRLSGKTTQAMQLAESLLNSNPLDYLIRFEQYQLGAITTIDFKAGITGELPYETYLELNSFYFSLGLYDLCHEVLALAPHYAMVSTWEAYLYFLQNNISTADDHLRIAEIQSPDFVFPHREEDITVLEWATGHYPKWKLKYYLALGYIQMLRIDEALQLLLSCGNEPDFYVFYIVRADLQRKKNEHACETDLREACKKAPSEWRPALLLSKYLGGKNRWTEALDVVENNYQQHTDNYYLGLQLAACYMHTRRYNDGIALMNKLTVLPNEGASIGRNNWNETNLLAALKAIFDKNWQEAIEYITHSREWPENLGVGKPYAVDERLADFLELHCLQQSNLPIPVGLADSIAFYRDKFPDTPYSSNDFLSMYILQQNNQFNMAQRILTDWLQHDNADLSAQWSLAFMNGDKVKINKIASIKPKKREALPYEILFEDRSFAFIKDMYSRGFFQMTYKTLI